MKIVAVPHSILNQSAKPVLQVDKKIHQLVKEMISLLNKQIDPPGVGLAAPQVGILLQLFIIKPTRKAKIEAFINPRIIECKMSIEEPASAEASAGKAKKNKNTPLEGCLSIRKIWGHVKRTKKVLLEYQTIDGGKKTEWFSGFKAVIIQHEIDHLNGILFTQRALEQGKQLYEEKEGKLEKIIS